RGRRRLLFRFEFLKVRLQRADFLLLYVDLLLFVGQLGLPGLVVYIVGIGIKGVLIQSQLPLQQIEFFGGFGKILLGLRNLGIVTLFYVGLPGVVDLIGSFRGGYRGFAGRLRFQLRRGSDVDAFGGFRGVAEIIVGNDFRCSRSRFRGLFVLASAARSVGDGLHLRILPPGWAGQNQKAARCQRRG